MKTYFLFRGHNRSGQSVLEYSAIAMLVIIGILAMGPYVVRSVNAYFKSAEEQAHDSFREDIRQTNLHGAEVNYDLGECDCSFSGTPVCGNGIMCPVTQFMYPYNCSPAGCLSDGDKLAYGFVKCEMEPNPLKSWTECFNTEGRFPYSEAEYQQWVADGCGFRCCTEAEQAEEQCYFFDDPDSSMSFGNTVVKYRGSPHDAANGWQLDVGDRILNSSDGKIYTVVGALPLPAGTAAYWDLNDNMLDIIGGNDGAIGGGANFVEGQVGGALEFDGATSYVEVPHSAALALTDFTLEAWVKSYGVAPNSAGAILTKGEGVVSGNLNYMMLLYNFYGSPYFSPLNTSNATYLACQFEDVTDANYYGIGLTPVSLNVFFHAACSFNTATGDMKVYINGVEQSVMLSRQGTTIASLAGLVPSTEPSDFYVGGGFSSLADTSGDDGVKNIFNGVIDEVGVYNRPLSSAEIYERYTVGLAGKVAGEWDGNEVVWDSGIGPLENTII